MDRIRVDLHGPPQTMLATLYAKALDADLPNPILGDPYAGEMVARIDYDWTKIALAARRAPAVTTRTAHFDSWAGQFLAAHPSAVVLHLGCGLDSRYLRLQPGPQVDWYDVDYPEVATLCTQLYPPAEHYHVVAASVTDPAWHAEIPDDRPTLMIAEGLTMYLSERDGLALLRRVVDRFPWGELQFDAFNRFAIRVEVINPVVRRSGSTLHWGIDGPQEILRSVPGTRLLSWVRWVESDTFQRLPRAYHVMGGVMSLLPALANMSQYHRYAFGPARRWESYAASEEVTTVSHPEIKEPSAGHPITIEPTPGRVQVRVNGELVADTTVALQLREATLPVVQYIPMEDVVKERLTRTDTHTYCPFKGEASYYSVTTPAAATVTDVIWTYDKPYPAVAAIAGHVAFYPDKAEISVSPQ